MNEPSGIKPRVPTLPNSRRMEEVKVKEELGLKLGIRNPKAPKVPTRMKLREDLATFNGLRTYGSGAGKS